MRVTVLATSVALLGVAHAANMTQGFDISSEDSDVDFEGAYNAGARYVSIRVTQGADTIDESAEKYWQQAKDAGLITQATHRLDPRQSPPKEQLDFFLKNGGDWGPGNFSLPGVLEILPNPNPDEDSCYGFESDELADYLRVWTTAYFDKYHRYSTLRVNTEWWDNCTYEQDLTYVASVTEFNVIDHVNTTIPEYYPYPWVWAYWQNAEHYEFGGKSAVSSDDYKTLKKHTNCHYC
ncbi:hypothetical protein FQN54_005264 [Arachnomyces sp. PD_36]|nr:hypothetical protein FQN54_005264 [Arachnomyces sp. PD_36]